MAAMNDIFETGTFVGRVWRPDVAGPSLVVLRGGDLYDITSKEAPTMRDLLERDDPVAFSAAGGRASRVVGGRHGASVEAAGDLSTMHLLAPCDLQAVKACGVTFARSMLERVIEEKAAGNPALAEKMRERVTAIIGDSLRDLKAGSPEAAKVKAALIDEGVWSQYLEVGIGPDAEVFSKAQVLASVGWGASVGLHPISRGTIRSRKSCWPSTARAASRAPPSATMSICAMSRGARRCCSARPRTTTHRPPSARSSACSMTLFDRRRAQRRSVADDQRSGRFRLKGSSTMREISRDPLDLVAQTIGRHHQYPDGLVLFMGTLFAPVEDRDAPGQGFTHKIGDVVTISNAHLGSLTNTVRLATECSPWTFGPSALMRNLAARGITLIQSAAAAKARSPVLALGAFSLSTSGSGRPMRR